MYVVTRRDLPPGYQLVQSCHAAREFAAQHPEFNGIANLACLSAKDEGALLDLASRLSERGAKCVVFREPDIGDQATALAAEPGPITKRLCARLPLSLAEEVAA